MARMYEVLFYNGWQDPPAYTLLSGIEGRSPKDALRRNLPALIADVRSSYGLDGEVSDDKICESLYAMRSDALVPAWRVLDQSYQEPA